MLYTVPEVARRLRVDIEDINYEIDQGHIQTIAIGNKVRVERESLNRFLEKRDINKAIFDKQRNWHWGVLGVLLMAGSVTAMTLVSPFPGWMPETINPQQAVFLEAGNPAEPDPARFAPIEAPLDYKRFNVTPVDEGTGITHMLTSLQLQNDVPPGSWSFPWTLFTKLDTNHDFGDGVGSIVNVNNRGAGWATGYHVDSIAEGTGTTLGSNIEMLNLSGDAYMVGMNVQNKAFRADVGLQIQTGPLPENHRWWEPGMDGSWQTGIRLEGAPDFGYYGTGIELGLNTHGDRGIWVRGNYANGIDLGTNDLTMQAGTRLELDTATEIALTFNKANGRIEFVNGDEVIGFLETTERNRDLGR